MPVFLRNVQIINGKTGVKINGGDVIAENVTFDNVDQPWDIIDAQSVNVRGTKIRNDPKKRGSERRASKGSRKPNGPPLPAFCPNCKTTFSSRNYNWGGANFSAWNNEETCPECGSETALLSEGVFDLSGEVVRILTAPDITYEMLAAIGRIADEALAQASIEPEPVIEKFNAVSPGLATFLRNALIQGQVFFNVAVAMAALGSFVLSGVQTKYAKEQTVIAKEQMSIAQKQLRDTTQAQILEELKEIRSNQTSVYKIQARGTKRLVHSSSQNNDPIEGRSLAMGAQKKVKARSIRRKGDAARRKALCPKPRRD